MTTRFSVSAAFKAIDQFTKPLRKMGGSVTQFVRNSNRALSRFNRGMNRVASGVGRFGKRAAIAFTGAAASAGFASKTMLDSFARLEDLEIGFTPLLGGDRGAAKGLVEKLQEQVAKTPISLQTLGNVSRSLLAQGAADLNTIIPTIRQLGDLTGGDNAKIERLAVNFGEIFQNGRAFTRDIRQFTTAGVPITQELQKISGLSGEAFQSFVTNGGVSFELIQKAMNNLTGETGKFFQAMRLAEGSLTARFNEAGDSIDRAKAAIGEGMAPVVKEIAQEVTKVAEQVRKWAVNNRALISQRMRDFFDAVKNGIAFLIDNRSKIAQYGKIIIGVGLALKVFTSAMLLANLAMAAAALPMAGTIAIVVGLTTAFGALVVQSGGFRNAFVSIIDELERLIPGLGFGVKIIVGLFDVINNEGFEGLKNRLIDAVKGAISTIKSIFKNIFSFGGGRNIRAGGAQGAGIFPSVQSSQTRAITESVSRSSTENTVLLKTEKGVTAESQDGDLPPQIRFATSGAF